ncbi:MAG: sigma 54-interacting transcriptional regulator [Magnetococcales bacterium]|nr:sigma 54-interacting transcriptional regulator [Magnetococcales bacterium]
MYGITGKAPCMQKLFRLIERVAASDSTVLIQGETGAGKELIARAVHQQSPRKDKPLIPVNCGAIPEDLLESELFGHVKGAFTGAVYTRPGRFELAQGGAIFLDEIGDMSPKLQVKMLRVLQEKVIEPVGSVKAVKVDVRIIAATHKNLEKEVAENRFREDLFYRLNVVPLHAPALRERPTDLPALVEHFLKKFTETQERVAVVIPPAVMALFQRYRWPGNVRELENLMERLMILCEGEVRFSDLPARMLEGEGNLNDAMPLEEDPRQTIPAAAFAIPAGPLSLESDDLDLDGEEVDFNRMVEDYENRLILSALERTGWNKNKAAQLLNLNRTTLVEKIKKKGLEPLERAAAG